MCDLRNSFINNLDFKFNNNLPIASGVPGFSGLLNGSLAVIGLEPVRGVDSPILLTALTLKL